MNILNHYTNTEALHGILKKDHICLWATHYKHLNDPNEQLWAEKVIKPILLNKCNYTEEMFDNLHSKYPYIISFCKNSDDMNMWRLYGNDGKGVMLEFDYDIIFNESEKHKYKDESDQDWDMLLPVEYACNNRECILNAFDRARKKHDYIYEQEDKIENDMEILAFVKNNGYAVENEIRYVRLKDNDMYFHGGEKGTFSYPENRDGVIYRNRDEKSIPYIELSFPIASLKRIIIGYYLNFQETSDSIALFMNGLSEDYHNVEIVKSKNLYK